MLNLNIHRPDWRASHFRHIPAAYSSSKPERLCWEIGPNHIGIDVPIIELVPFGK